MSASILENRCVDHGRHILLVMLGGFKKCRVEIIVQRDVQTIHPHRWSVALAAMIVPGHGWIDCEVSTLQKNLVTMDGTVRALAFDHESHGLRAMAMRGFHLAPVQPLNCGPQRRRGVGYSPQPRV